MSIIAGHDVMEVAMNGLLVWAIIIGTILLVVVAVVTLLRGRINPP